MSIRLHLYSPDDSLYSDTVTKIKTGMILLKDLFVEANFINITYHSKTHYQNFDGLNCQSTFNGKKLLIPEIK